MSASIAAPARFTPLVGENGSGKSTLLGIASGFVDPDLGTVQIGGEPLRRDSPAQARKLGLAMAYQDTSLILARAREEQPLSSRRPTDRRPRVLAEEAVGAEAAGRVRPRPRAVPGRPGGFPHPGRPPAVRGGQGARHRSRRCCCSTSRPRPSARTRWTRCTAPSPRCRRRGVGVVYVSHRLPEVLEVADRITVLRDGRNQGTFDAKTTTEAELVELIVGRPFEAAFPPPAPEAAEAREVLVVDGLQGQSFGPVSFTLRRRRDRGDRRRRGQRPAPALRLPGGPPAAESGTGRLRRQGAVADLDPRGGRARESCCCPAIASARR